MSSELGSMALERFEQEIGELAAHIHAATCRWLLLVAEFDRREGWQIGERSPAADWLSWRCGVAPRAAREQVRVARRLAELPLACEAFGRGELSYSKVRAISRVASAETEPDWSMLAQHATAGQLDRLVRAYRGVVSAQVEQANRNHAERFLDWEWDDDGSLLLRGRLPAEDGALVVKALEAARDRLREPTAHDGDGECGSAEPPSADLADNPEEAELAHVPRRATPMRSWRWPRRSSPTALPSETPASATRSSSTSTPQALTEDAGSRAASSTTVRRFPRRPPVGSRATRAWSRSPSATGGAIGRPQHAHDPTRPAPRAGRRDGGCRFPGCGQRAVDAHHLHHWAHGGETKLDNLCSSAATTIDSCTRAASA